MNPASPATAPLRRCRPTPLLTVLLAVLGACQAPGDPSEFWWPDTDGAGDGAVEADGAGPGGLGAACDDQHPCPSGLECGTPAECRVPDGTSGGGGGDRCDEERPCGDGLVCEPLSDVGVCMRDCLSDGDCPTGGVCWSERGPVEGWCVRPGGLLGAACSFENDCQPGLFCENRASGGYCTKTCDAGVPCPAGMSAVCTRLSGEFGIYCLQRCTDDRESCREDVECRKMTKADEYVCFPSF